jgi:ketosteroid isomerase-like protein
VSDSNLSTIRRVYELWNTEGMQTALPLIDDAAEFVNPESAIEPGTHHGHAGWVKAQDAMDAAFEDYVHEPEHLIDAGDKVLAVVTFRARGRDSGVHVEKEEQHVWTLRGGRVVRFQWFHDEHAARLAADL